MMKGKKWRYYLFSLVFIKIFNSIIYDLKTVVILIKIESAMNDNYSNDKQHEI